MKMIILAIFFTFIFGWAGYSNPGDPLQTICFFVAVVSFICAVLKLIALIKERRTPKDPFENPKSDLAKQINER